MHRPRHLWCLLLIPVLVAVVLSAAGCGGSEHELMIKKFFMASAAGDTATLGNIATVSFDPNRDGRAQSVSVVSETPEQTRVLKLKDLDKAYKDAQTAEGDFSKKMKEYQDKNLEAINRVLKAEGARAKLGGKDAAVEATWTKWRDDAKAYNTKVSEARTALNAERRVADLSLPDRDATTFEATEGTKEVTVTANVRTPDNKTADKTFVLTLQRVVLKDDAGKTIEGKWMITGIKEAGK